MRIKPSLLVLLSTALCMGLMAPKPSRSTAPTGDDRVGVITDQQGSAMVRPVGRQRWTPLRPKSLLLPGDQVRTSPRGANAIEIQLPGRGSLVLGPGGLIELEAQGKVRLYRGELELKASKGQEISVHGPGKYRRIVKGRLLLRGLKAGTKELDKAPRWLSGYHDSTTDEWMGSLIANVDGREMPLSVGYHKVIVDINDQIARTTVEQSFVNSTESRLEGVFYFPLPADASISGFGMWIGGELVEADIVEKQRARAIFEDILRRRKDPGLLEWTGGNMFKARVFPIEAHSEKRIRIRYTQVLPLAGKQMRYRYALRSELLRNRPLRELQLKINVSSTMPIVDVSSPSHELRIRKTRNTAVAEFDAQEYTPERDLELEIDLDSSKTLTLVPHRRGEDGYFMLLLSPPGSGDGTFKRDLTAEGKPLSLVLLADTSASMDQSARKTQATFLSGLLSLLGKRDRFQLLSCDIEVDQYRAEAVPTTEEHAQAALEFLARRPSLGWTDLDLALTEACRRAGRGGLVVYVGDGIGTTGNADPVALAQRLRLLESKYEVSCHGVSTSSTYEKVVLEAMASLGGGSVRAADGRPLDAAYALLAEVAQPAIKNLRIQFEGFRTARVLPERLPNLPAGSQQVVLGRYLPLGHTQKGRVILTGTLNGKPIRQAAEVDLPSSDAGNSFIPRLWARRQVDALLAQGQSKEVQQDIIALSEEYSVMTPYTSFLVLENDEDRKRYGVERRVKMRDGERFFAEGRNKAETEILRQQMKLARTWRLRLRAKMLREIAALGRNLLQSNYAYGYGNEWGRKKGRYERSDEFYMDSVTRAGGLRPEDEMDLDHEGLPEENWERRLSKDMEVKAEAEERSMPERSSARPTLKPRAPAAGVPYDMVMRQPQPRASGLRGWLAEGKKESAQMRAMSSRENRLRGDRDQNQPNLHSLHFPFLPPAPNAVAPKAKPDWPAEILSLLQRLNRRSVQASLEGGLEIRYEGQSLHHLLLSRDAWYQRQQYQGNQSTESYATAEHRAAVTSGFRLGRRRKAVELDRTAWQLPYLDLWIQDLTQRYHQYDAKMQSREGDRVTILLSAKEPQQHQCRLVIDQKRVVILEVRYIQGGRISGRAEYSEFENVAASWWPTRFEIFDGENQKTGSHELSIKELGKSQFDTRMQKILEGFKDVVFLERQDPTLKSAKKAIAEKRAKLEDHLVLFLHYCQAQQWDKAKNSFEESATLIGDKHGLDWLRLNLLAWSRQGKDLEQLILKLAGITAKTAGTEALFLAEHLLNISASGLHPNEALMLLDRLKPVYVGHGPQRQKWLSRRAGLLERAGRATEALAMRQQLADLHPEDIQNLMALIRAHLGRSEQEKAVALARKGLTLKTSPKPYQRRQLYEQLVNVLWQRRQLDDLHAVLGEWLEEKPTHQDPYKRYLSVLMMLGREREADRWIAERLAEAIGDTVDPAFRARLSAAIMMAQGRGWNFSTHQVDPRWTAPLKRLALRLARHKTSHFNLVGQILQHHHFKQTDEYRQLLSALEEDLRQEKAVEEMNPYRLGLYLSWIDWRPSEVDEKLWEEITARLHRRYVESPTVQERQSLAPQLLRLLDARHATKRAIAFLELRLEMENEAQIPNLARLLFDRLCGQAWSETTETRLFELLALLTNAKQPAAQTIRRLADALYKMRRDHLLGPKKEYEKLPRSELRLRIKEARKQARKALAASFEAAAWAGNENENEALRPFYQIESLCFAVELGEDPKATDGEAREFLFSLRKEGDRIDYVARVLRERCSLVLSYAACHRSAPEGLADSLLEFYRQSQDKEPKLLDWRYQIYRLLLALDRSKDLETDLRSWTAENKWRRALGYVLAEGGKLEEASIEFEALAKSGKLGAKEYESLANWYLVMHKDEQREKAILGRYQAMPAHRLQNLLYQEGAKIARQGEGIPQELNPEALRMLQVLLGKATNPQQYISQVRNLYASVKDFRLLAGLADALLGHSPQNVYPSLGQAWSLISMVHEEATCDELARRIQSLQKDASKPTDRRALMLLVAMVERRAAEVLNAPGPHIQRSLDALQEAYKGSWLKGEPRLWANYLASLGRIPHVLLAAEQLRQLRLLDRLESEKGMERLAISYDLARTLWGYKKTEEALGILTTALDRYRDSKKGILGPEANGQLSTLLGWLESRRRFAKAESLIERELVLQGKQSGQKIWMTRRLFDLYLHCLDLGGSLSVGKGEALYLAARQRIEKALFGMGSGQVQNTLQKYLSLHSIAHKKARIKRVGADLQTFADGKLDELVTLGTNNRQNMVRNVASTMHKISGPLPALRLLLRQWEKEPRWLTRVQRGGWQVYGYQIAEYRYKAKHIGDLEPQLLALVLAELERDLTHMRAFGRTIYSRRNSYYWQEKHAEFKRVAYKIVELHADSAARQLYVADYVWNGLRLYREAIDILMQAEARGKLAENGRYRLVTWLQGRSRWAESIEILEKLITHKPNKIEYLIPMVRALHETKNDPAALALLDSTETLFERQKRWTEQVLSQLAYVSNTCKFWKRSVAYYEELIALHQRTRSNRGVGNGTLSSYYGQLSKALVHLGETDKAVEAASAAVLAWGRNRQNRQSALGSLRLVLQQCRDLDGYVGRWNAKVKETGLDAPVIRKAIGLVYLQKRKPRRAIANLSLARELQPTDPEIHQNLLRAYDLAKDEKGACAVLLDSIHASPLELKLYKTLGERYLRAGLPTASERAWTSLVEAKPNEAESHRILARHREAQGRHKEAVVQWQQVVRIRSFEPAGYLALAKAQRKAGQPREASKTLQRLEQLKGKDLLRPPR